MTKEELREFILNNFPIKNGKLTTDPVRWCVRKYPHLIDIINGYGEYDKLSDNIYSIILDRTNRCRTCGKLISLTWMTRDNKYCSRKCMAESTEWKELSQKTSLERYGVDNPMKAETVKEKARQTSLERYGVPNPAMSEEIIKKIDDTFYSRYGVRRATQVDEFKEKQFNTNLERYSSVNPLCHPAVREKRDNTMLGQYGTTHALQVDEFKEKAKNTMLSRYGVTNPMHSPYLKNKSICARLGIEYSDTPKKTYLESLGIGYTKSTILVGPTKYGMVSKECIKAQLDGTVNREMLISEFGDYHRVMKKLGIEATGNITTPHQILIDWLNELKIEFTVNDRQTIKPKELDIYIPSYKLAIEVNGLYWHSAVTTDTRHIDKFNQCRLLGIKLLQFTDKDIINRLELVKSMILSKLGKLPNKIMARKCSIVDIGSNDAQRLLEQWHYQGRTTNAAKFLGLNYNNRIVAIIGYTIKGTECRIERFACELMTNVVGGYSKLEKFVINSYDISTIVTFSLGLISDGSVYAKNGYTTLGYATTPEWYVTDYKNLYNRQRFMKHKLPILFGDNFDPNKTERENILLNGFRLYFGAGITKWVKELIH